MTRARFVALVAVPWFVGMLEAALCAAPPIPRLDWAERSDWVNVRTDVEPKAVGDGRADDTAAMQAGLDTMHGQGGPPKVVYIPPGTYRITKTLVMPSSVGCMVIGHGRDTRIAWDGPASYPEEAITAREAEVDALRQNPKFPGEPDESEVTNDLFKLPKSAGDHYGARLSGYLKAPQTGEYVFWMASDDYGELWLSGSADPEGRKKIAWLDGWCFPEKWDHDPTQKSKPVRLRAGSFYYVEALVKEGGGGDHLAVGWQLPDGTQERPIPATRVFRSAGAGAKAGILYEMWKDPVPRLRRMLWSNGATIARYVGIVWDANGRASIGVHHNARDRFECKVRHEHEAFVGFEEAGVKMGPQNPFATSESVFSNCYFESCGAGISMVDFNYYNEVVEGCEFVGCGYGVFCTRYGEVYVRDTHFEGSTKADLCLGDSHKHSARRCTSVGSRMFLEGQDVTIQDCRIEAWTNTEAAVTITAGGAPVPLFDCVFTRPPGANPPIKVLQGGQKLILSGNISRDTDGLVSGDADVVEVPPGPRSGAGGAGRKLPGERGSALTSARRRFLRSRASVPGKVFDAVKDFGAGRGDCTGAVQAAIDAAREHGEGAIAYFPPQRYPVKETIRVTGGDYYIGGTGYHSEFQWAGPEGGVLMEVEDPRGITIEEVNFIGHSVPKGMAAIRVRGSGGGSDITLDRVMVPDWWRTDAGENARGVHFVGFGARDRIHIRRLNGSAQFTNCSAAQVLANFLDSSPVVVEGPRAGRGFLGVLNVNTGGIVVRDSLDLVIGDGYCEQGKGWLINAAGSAGDAPGRLTIGAARLHQWEDSEGFARIDNYAGLFSYSHAHVTFDRSKDKYLVKHTGARPIDVLLMAHTSLGFDFKLGGTARLLLVQNGGAANRMPAGSERSLARVLDHFRELGLKDIEFNHPDADR